MTRKLVTLLGVTVVTLVLFAGCAPVRERLFARPDLPEDWRGLLAAIRVFEKTLGFRETPNFAVQAGSTQGEYTQCGHTPRFKLPYSYEDPVIRWSEAANETECREGSPQDDYYFVRVEAMGEVATPITDTVLARKLDRFIYLVIHEDCHDQFDFPYGFEEALCNLIAYEGMSAFARQHYAAWSRNGLAVRAYAREQVVLTRAVVSYYNDTARLYARHASGEVAEAAALLQRARLFAAAERTLGWHQGAMNNVGLANEMTYSRHYPFVARVHDALNADLVHTVAFFKRVDGAKPAREAVLQGLSLDDAASVQAVAAQEAAAVETTTRLMRGYNHAVR